MHAAFEHASLRASPKFPLSVSAHDDNSSANALASLRSRVSKPSVNQP